MAVLTKYGMDHRLLQKNPFYWFELTSCAGCRNVPRPCRSLTLWAWKWCPSHVWRGLPLYQY